MSRPFTEGWLYGWNPDNPNEGSNNVRYADYKFHGDDVEFVDLNERAEDLKDVATVQIHNDDGEYTRRGRSEIIDHGDRVEFQTRRGRPLKAYGSGLYGDGLYQPELRVRWTGIVRNFSVASNGRNLYELEFDAEDFAYAIMSMRRTTNAWEDEPIVTGPGSGQGIINTVLENECPELDLSQLPDHSERTTLAAPDKNVLEVVVEAANRANLIMWADGTTVRLEKPDDIATEFEVTTDDYTLYSFSSNDDAVFNQVRVEGGRSHDIHEEQTVQDGWTTVTKDSRATQRINTRKSEVDRVEIWTDPTRTGSEEDVVVRLQKDDGGAPVAPGNTKSDIARKSLSHHFLASDGWTTFIMPEHDLPDASPWLIVESSDSAGQDIGIDTSTGDLTYRSHYPYPIRVRRDDKESQEDYRLREDTLNDDTVDDLTAARDAGDAYIDHRAQPDLELQLDADSDRLHDTKPGDVLRLDFEEIDAAGRFVCIERSVEWGGNRETAAITLRDVASL